MLHSIEREQGDTYSAGELVESLGRSEASERFFDELEVYIARGAGVSRQHLDRESAVAAGMRRLKVFREKVDAGEAHLDTADRVFADTVHSWAQLPGFPISPAQVDERLSGYVVGFSDVVDTKGAYGTHAFLKGVIEVSAASPASAIVRTVHHERWHSMAGNSVFSGGVRFGVRNGFEYSLSDTKQGNTFNEAWVELMSMMSASSMSQEVSFEDDEESIAHFWELAERAFEMGNMLDESYHHEIDALLVSFKDKVKPSTLMRAFLKRDNDPHEDDVLAGTHALRDVQRELKQFGGNDWAKDVLVLWRMPVAEIDAKQIRRMRVTKEFPGHFEQLEERRRAEHERMLEFARSWPHVRKPGRFRSLFGFAKSA